MQEKLWSLTFIYLIESRSHKLTKIYQSTEMFQKVANFIWKEMKEMEKINGTEMPFPYVKLISLNKDLKKPHTYYGLVTQ